MRIGMVTQSIVGKLIASRDLSTPKHTLCVSPEKRHLIECCSFLWPCFTDALQTNAINRYRVGVYVLRFVLVALLFKALVS